MADYETRRWSRVEYEKMIALGVFRSGEAIELRGREPRPDAAAAFGWSYARTDVAGVVSEVTPLAVGSGVRVSDLLP